MEQTEPVQWKHRVQLPSKKLQMFDGNVGRNPIEAAAVADRQMHAAKRCVLDNRRSGRGEGMGLAATRCTGSKNFGRTSSKIKMLQKSVANSLIT